MTLTLGGNKVEVDVAATKEMYKAREFLTYDCACPACRNYMEQIKKKSPKVRAFFEDLGVIPKKAAFAWPHLPGDKPYSQVYYCLYPLACSVAEYVGDTETEEIDEGFSATVTLKDGEYYLKAYWTLKWARP